jgi:hypothetical protein
MVFALAGDSTMTRCLPAVEPGDGDFVPPEPRVVRFRGAFFVVASRFAMN